MGDYFIGEIRIFPYNRIPTGWLVCEGQVLPIQQNQALAAILANLYGGDGRTTFGIPDLRGKVPISAGVSKTTPTISYPIANTGGEATHVLTVNEIPNHQHNLLASSAAANQKSPSGTVWANQNNIYAAPATPGQNMNPQALANSGTNTAHNNMQPFLALCFCISTSGIFPQRP